MYGKLENDANDKVVKRFETKEDATAGGVLKKALGPEGGSVRIEKKHGGYQEERTFPRSKDPRRSKGQPFRSGRSREDVVYRVPIVSGLCGSISHEDVENLHDAGSRCAPNWCTDCV